MVDYSYRDSPYDTFKGSSVDSGFIDFTEEDYERFEKLGLNVQNALAKGATAEEVSQAAKNIEQKQIQTSEREVTRQESGLAPPPIQSRPTNIPYQDVPPQPVDDSFWQTDTGPVDMAKSAGAAFSNLAGTVVGHGVEWLGEQLQSPTMFQAGQMIKDSSRMTSEKLMGSMSEGAKAEAYGPRSIFKYKEEGDVLPSGLGNMTLGTIQQLIASGAASSLGILGPAKLIASKLQKIPKVTPGQAGAVGMGTSAGVIEGTATAADVYESTKNTPPEVIVQSPLYQETREHIKAVYPEATEDQLKEFITEQIAKQASWESGWRAGAGIGVTSMPVGSFLGKMGLFGKKAGGPREFRKGLLPSAWTGTTKEARQEFYQEAGQQVSQNFGDYLVGKSPNAINLSGVLEAGAAGALGGGPVGGALATYGNLQLPQKQRFTNAVVGRVFDQRKPEDLVILKNIDPDAAKRAYGLAEEGKNFVTFDKNLSEKTFETLEEAQAFADSERRSFAGVEAEEVVTDLDDAKLSILHELRFPKRYKKRTATEYREVFEAAGLKVKRGDTLEDILKNNNITEEDIQIHHANLKKEGRLPDEIVEEKAEAKKEAKVDTTQEDELDDMDLGELRTLAREEGVDSDLLDVLDKQYSPELKNPSSEELNKVADKLGMESGDLYDAIEDQGDISKIIADQIRIKRGKKPKKPPDKRPPEGPPPPPSGTATEKATAKDTTEKPVTAKDTTEKATAKDTTEKPVTVEDEEKQKAHAKAVELYETFEATKKKSAVEVLRDNRDKDKSRGELGKIAKSIGVEYQKKNKDGTGKVNKDGTPELLTKHQLAENILAYGKKASKEAAKAEPTVLDTASEEARKEIREAKAGGKQKGVRFVLTDDELVKAMQEEAGFNSEKMQANYQKATNRIADLEDKGVKRITFEESQKLAEKETNTEDEKNQIALAVAHEFRDYMDIRMAEFSPSEKKKYFSDELKRNRKRINLLITKFLMGATPGSLGLAVSIQSQLLSNPKTRKIFIEYLELERLNAKMSILMPDDDLNPYGYDSDGEVITAPLNAPPEFVTQDEINLLYTRIHHTIGLIEKELNKPPTYLTYPPSPIFSWKGGLSFIGFKNLKQERVKMDVKTGQERASSRRKSLEQSLERLKKDMANMEEGKAAWYGRKWGKGHSKPKLIKYTKLDEDTVILKALQKALGERDAVINSVNNIRTNRQAALNKKLKRAKILIKKQLAEGTITKEEAEIKIRGAEELVIAAMRKSVDGYVKRAAKAEAKFAELAKKHGFSEVDFKPKVYDGDDETDLELEDARVKEESRLFTERMNSLFNDNIYVGPAGGYAQLGRPVISEDENNNIYEHAYHQLGMTGDSHSKYELSELNNLVNADIAARDAHLEGKDATWFKRQESGTGHIHWRFDPDNGSSFHGYKLVRTHRGVETQIAGVGKDALRLFHDKERLMKSKEKHLDKKDEFVDQLSKVQKESRLFTDKTSSKKRKDNVARQEALEAAIREVDAYIAVENSKLLGIERKLSATERRMAGSRDLHSNNSAYKNWKFGNTARRPTSKELYGVAVTKARKLNPSKPVKVKKNSPKKVYRNSTFSRTPHIEGSIVEEVDDRGYYRTSLSLNADGNIVGRMERLPEGVQGPVQPIGIRKKGPDAIGMTEFPLGVLIPGEQERREAKRKEFKKELTKDLAREVTLSPRLSKGEMPIALSIVKNGGVTTIHVMGMYEQEFVDGEVREIMEPIFLGYIEIEDGKVGEHNFNKHGIESNGIHMESIDKLIGAAVGVYVLQYNQTGVSLHSDFYNFQGTMSRIMRRIPPVRETLTPEQQTYYDKVAEALDAEYEIVSTDNYHGYESRAEALRSIPHTKAEEKDVGPGRKGEERLDYYIHQGEDGLFYVLPKGSKKAAKKKPATVVEVAQKEAELEMKQAGVEDVTDAGDVTQEMTQEETVEEPVAKPEEFVPWEESDEFVSNWEQTSYDMELVREMRTDDPGIQDEAILGSLAWHEAVPTKEEVDKFFKDMATAKAQHELKGGTTEEQTEAAEFEEQLEAEGLGVKGESRPKQAVRKLVGDAYDVIKEDEEASIGQFDNPSGTQEKVDNDYEGYTDDNTGCGFVV